MTGPRLYAALREIDALALRHGWMRQPDARRRVRDAVWAPGVAYRRTPRLYLRACGRHAVEVWLGDCGDFEQQLIWTGRLRPTGCPTELERALGDWLHAVGLLLRCAAVLALRPGVGPRRVVCRYWTVDTVEWLNGPVEMSLAIHPRRRYDARPDRAEVDWWDGVTLRSEELAADAAAELACRLAQA